MISLDVSYGFSYVLSSSMLPVSLAIRPITVLSPVFTTISVQVPVYGDDLVTVILPGQPHRAYALHDSSETNILPHSQVRIVS